VRAILISISLFSTGMVLISKFQSSSIDVEAWGFIGLICALIVVSDVLADLKERT
jgi:hypothetical protein